MNILRLGYPLSETIWCSCAVAAVSDLGNVSSFAALPYWMLEEELGPLSQVSLHVVLSAK